MRDTCNCPCHSRTIECSPCWRLHKLAEHLVSEFERESLLASRQRAQYPSIIGELSARAQAFEDAKRAVTTRLHQLGNGPRLDSELYAVETRLGVVPGVAVATEQPADEVLDPRCPSCGMLEGGTFCEYTCHGGQSQEQQAAEAADYDHSARYDSVREAYAGS